MRKENWYLIVVILVTIIGGIIFFNIGKSALKSKEKQEKQEIIDCLLFNNVKLYISSDCPYCLKQKEIFGEHFLKVNYINCQEDNDWSEVCRKEKINSVPTWVFPSILKTPKDKILSCEECQRKAPDMRCNDYCYTESEDGQTLRISGFLEIDKINEIFGCKRE